MAHGVFRLLRVISFFFFFFLSLLFLLLLSSLLFLLLSLLSWANTHEYQKKGEKRQETGLVECRVFIQRKFGLLCRYLCQ